MELTGSIVLYKSPPELAAKAIHCFLQVDLSKQLFLVDNSPSDDLSVMATHPNETHYIKTERNLGFGKAHNIAMQKALQQSKYHLVLNPDVSFEPGTVERLVDFMEKEPAIGLVIPKVLDFQSKTQYVCKRLPSPVDLIVRRLGWNFLNKIFKRKLYLYEMRDKDLEKTFEAPSISGCFMLFRVDALKQAGLFDERFFMYMEDVDLSRRVHKYFRTCCYPSVYIFHGHARESYRWNKQLIIHMMSAVKYFNKWGWFLDSERDLFNT